MLKVKNVEKCILKPSPTDLERFRRVLGVKKAKNFEKPQMRNFSPREKNGQ